MKGSSVRILSFGSLNIDHVYQVPHFVSPGETLSSSFYKRCAGGKGLNQSIALSRAGCSVSHVGQISNDGLFLKNLLNENHVDTNHVVIQEQPTGHAIIQVTPEGENSIVLYGGANQCLKEDFCDLVLTQSQQNDVVLLQNEINQNEFILRRAKELDLPVIFNPSPWQNSILKWDLSAVKLFVLNEQEALGFAGQTQFDEEQLVDVLRQKFPHADFVVTRGSKGSLFFNQKNLFFQDVIRTDLVVDTTGAGDTFLGFFVASYLRQDSIQTCLKRASHAAALCVTREGASSSIPQDHEIRV